MEGPIPFVKVEEFQEKIIESNKPSVVWFTVPSCVPCRKIEPRISNLYYNYKSKMDFFRLDIEKYPEKAQEYKILNTPVLVFFKDGRETERQDWLPTREEILEAIQRNI